MHTTTLMLDLKEKEIRSLMTLCQSEHRPKLAELCGSEDEASALMCALDEITWQLASGGHEGAIDALSKINEA